MVNLFSFDEEMEQVLLFIEKDKAVLKKLSVGELESINKYLTEKTEYLKEVED